MSDSTPQLEQIATAQAQKEVTANGLFDAVSPAGFGGRHAEACSGLTWGYYGGRWGGTLVANGTLAIPTSSVAYLVANRATGAISQAAGSPTEWDDLDNYVRLYKVTAGASTITSYEDHRAGPGGTTVGGAGGSGTNFSEALNTSTPNATITVASLTATGAATNIDAVFAAKGGGDTLAQVPDNTTAGGNKRGGYSVDWQRLRTDAAMVAGGYAATLSGGRNGRASGLESTVLGGNGSVASNEGAVAGGTTCTASGLNSVAIGYNAVASGSYSTSIGTGNTANAYGAGAFAGNGNVVSGTQAAALGGETNTVNSAYSVSLGGQQAHTLGIIGVLVRGAAIFNGAGDNQAMSVLLSASTTNATAKAMTADRGAAGTTNQLVLANGSTFAVQGRVVACRTDGGGARDSKAWAFSCLVKRDSGAGTTAIVGTPTYSVLGADSGASTWDLTVSADTTNGALSVNATGQSGATIKWVAEVMSSQFRDFI